MNSAWGETLTWAGARFYEVFSRYIGCTAEEIARDMVRGKIERLLRGWLLFERSRLTAACPETSGHASLKRLRAFLRVVNERE